MFFFCLSSTIESGTDCSDNKLSAAQLSGLIKRISENDDDAFVQLYNMTKSAVYGYILSILNNPHDAEEIMQDTYLTINLKAGDFKPGGSAMAWILTIAKNHALMRLRKQKAEVMTDQPPEIADPRQPFDQVNDRLVLSALMKVLTDDERQIVMLYAVAGLKHHMIAKLCGITLTAELSKYHRALKKLKKQMGE
jgi:RNA polymerase sigma factor, sigma-70 family